MVALAKVQQRGQVTLSKEIRQALGLRPGDTVMIRSTGPGSAEPKVLPRLTLADLIERYPIDGPVDGDADRAAWEAEAAKDVLERSDA